MKIVSDGTEISYAVRGNGPPVVLLHPFPSNHHFWDECIPFLEHRYKLVLPDIRGHGDSPPGEGPATMKRHAHDLAQLCEELRIGKAVFAGVSIGGYILFEFWRQSRDRVAAVVLANTRATADTVEGRANREKSNQEVELRGPALFIESMLPKLLGKTTLETKPERVAAAREVMSRMSVRGIVALQQGMAARPDSVATLKTIDVPALIIGGEEDSLIPAAETQLMQHHISRSRLEIVPKAGHYAAFEQPEHCGRLVRRFLDSLQLGS